MHTTVPQHKHIALVAHDHKKQDLIDWCKKHKDAVQPHTFCGTGTTGQLVADALGFTVTRF